MEDIIIIRTGIEPTIYFKHLCTQCDALLEVKITIKEFNCPKCDSDEICIQSPEMMVKKYIRESINGRQLENRSSSKRLMKKSKK